ncbi:hypothetical protein [Sphingomonas aquatilis]
MFILKSKHDAAIAAKDAEIAGLMRRVTSLAAACEAGDVNEAGMLSTIADLRAQLTRYTAPRERGEGGRFLPLKRVS